MRGSGNGTKRGVRFARVNVKWHDIMISNREAHIAGKEAPTPMNIYPVVQWQAHSDIISDISHIASGRFVDSQSNNSDAQDDTVLQATKSPVLMTASSDGLAKMWCIKTGQFLGALDVYASHSKSKKKSHPKKGKKESVNENLSASAWAFPGDTDGRLSAQRKEAVEVMSGVPIMDEQNGGHVHKKEIFYPHHQKKHNQDPGLALGLGNSTSAWSKADAQLETIRRNAYKAKRAKERQLGLLRDGLAGREKNDFDLVDMDDEDFRRMIMVDDDDEIQSVSDDCQEPTKERTLERIAQKFAVLRAKENEIDRVGQESTTVDLREPGVLSARREDLHSSHSHSSSVKRGGQLSGTLARRTPSLRPKTSNSRISKEKKSTKGVVPKKSLHEGLSMSKTLPINALHSESRKLQDTKNVPRHRPLTSSGMLNKPAKRLGAVIEPSRGRLSTMVNSFSQPNFMLQSQSSEQTRIGSSKSQSRLNLSDPEWRKLAKEYKMKQKLGSQRSRRFPECSATKYPPIVRS